MIMYSIYDFVDCYAFLEWSHIRFFAESLLIDKCENDTRMFIVNLILDQWKFTKKGKGTHRKLKTYDTERYPL